MENLGQLIDKVLADGGTDLHLHESCPPLYRLHGSLIPLNGNAPLQGSEIKQMIQEVCSQKAWDSFEETGDLDFGFSYNDQVRFRASCKKHYQGYGAVFRVIPSRIMSFEQIRAPEALRQFAEIDSGLVLITGATGVGKTTTLATIIDHVNETQQKVIVTIEEPIEYVHRPKKSMVIQREVGTDVQSFSDGLRAALRQDAQVVLVGEMRDLETISLAVKAAEMGLLVFATLHTNSVVNTVNRIVDVFPPDEQRSIRETLAVALRAVCCQLLLPRADGTGRVPAHEILLQTHAVSNLIRENQAVQINQVIQSGRAMGMRLMDDALEILYQQGLISGTEAYMKAMEKTRFHDFAPSMHEPLDGEWI